MTSQFNNAFTKALFILQEQGLTKTLATRVKEDSIQWVQWMRPDIQNSDQAQLWSISEGRSFFYDEKHRHMWYKNVFLPTLRATAGQHPEQLCVGVQFFGISQREQQEQESDDEYCFRRFSLLGNEVMKKISQGNQPSVLHRIRCNETSYNHNQTPLGFSHPFLPEALSPSYANSSLKINSDTLESFLEYYSSCSIRHKILHPLFLFLKFPKALTLYYNTRSIDENTEIKEGSAGLILEIQTQIYSQLSQEDQNRPSTGEEDEKPFKTSHYPLLGISANQYAFSLSSQSSLEDRKSYKQIQQKISRFLKPLSNQLVQFFPDSREIPSFMKEFAFKDSLKESYAAVYNQLSALKTKYSDISSMSENSVQQTQLKRKANNNSCESGQEELDLQDAESDENNQNSKQNSLNQWKPPLKQKKLKVDTYFFDKKNPIPTSTKQVSCESTDKYAEDDNLPGLQLNKVMIQKYSCGVETPLSIGQPSSTNIINLQQQSPQSLKLPLKLNPNQQQQQQVCSQEYIQQQQQQQQPQNLQQNQHSYHQQAQLQQAYDLSQQTLIHQQQQQLQQIQIQLQMQEQQAFQQQQALQMHQYNLQQQQFSQMNQQQFQQGAMIQQIPPVFIQYAPSTLSSQPQRQVFINPIQYPNYYFPQQPQAQLVFQPLYPAINPSSSFGVSQPSFTPNTML